MGRLEEMVEAAYIYAARMKLGLVPRKKSGRKPMCLCGTCRCCKARIYAKEKYWSNKAKRLGASA